MTLPENSHQKEDQTVTPGLTPHQLAERHLKNPDDHITDEDMENMIISVELSGKEKAASAEEAEEFGKNKVGTSYDVLD